MGIVVNKDLVAGASILETPIKTWRVPKQAVSGKEVRGLEMRSPETGARTTGPSLIPAKNPFPYFGASNDRN